MSEESNIVTLAGRFATNKDLQKYCDTQFLALQSAAEKIQRLQVEIEHLQGLLAGQSPSIERLLKSPELAICEAQIGMFQNRALIKELTLEEVKILDLLVKNKLLLSGQATTIEGTTKKKSKEEYSEAELIKIAQQGKPND